jgi:YVTN family beta-propeller protein
MRSPDFVPPRRRRRRLRRGAGLTAALLLASLASAAAEKKAPVPEAPPPQGLLIVLNKEDSTVSFIELLPAKRAADRMRLLRTAPSGAQPHEVAVSPDGREAWVSNAGAGTLSVFDLGRLEEVASVRHEGFKFPHGSAFTPDGKKFYLACTERNSVFAIDPAGRRVLAEIPTGQSDSHMVAMAPDGARIFVPNIGSRSVSVIATAEDRLLSPILVGRGPEGIALTPDGRRLLVANQEDSTMSVIDTAALRVVDAFEVGEFPVRTLVTPDGGRAFTADRKGNTLTVVNLRGEYASVARRLPVGKSPGGMALDGAGRTLFVALNDEARVVLIDAVTLEKTGEIRVGRGPDGVAFVPGWKR